MILTYPVILVTGWSMLLPRIEYWWVHLHWLDMGRSFWFTLQSSNFAPPRQGLRRLRLGSQGCVSWCLGGDRVPPMEPEALLTWDAASTVVGWPQLRVESEQFFSKKKTRPCGSVLDFSSKTFEISRFCPFTWWQPASVASPVELSWWLCTVVRGAVPPATMWTLRAWTRCSQWWVSQSDVGHYANI